MNWNLYFLNLLTVIALDNLNIEPIDFMCFFDVFFIIKFGFIVAESAWKEFRTMLAFDLASSFVMLTSLNLDATFIFRVYRKY